MSEFNEYDPIKFEEELAVMRKKERRKMIAVGFAAGLLVALGAGFYISDARAGSSDSVNYSQLGNYQSVGYTSGSSGATLGGAGGGCCGGGAGSGSSISNISLSDLEKQALAQYKKEKGASDVKAKATNYGCHIQIDISDAEGNIVRSYGYQGGSLYVIK